MRADLPSEFLTDDSQGYPGSFRDVENVRDKRRIQFNRQSRREINSEVIMRDQYNAARRQNFHEGLPNQLGIRISEVVAGDLPHFREGSPESVADCVEARAPACYECRRRCSGIDFSCRRKKFHCRVVNDAVAVSDVSKDSRHYFSPPLAAMSSSTLSMFSSRLPES